MANRYWVPSGGNASGTWDATSTANWSTTSGGAGGASAPRSADDVFFDAGSDAGGIFTVTIGTGAVCRDITAGSLDFVMTLAGSAALGIYGSLTFPATNFTRTYTGLITFAAITTGKTITTNGVSLASALTFNGVGGFWTLSGALTTSGIIRLTNGTFDVSASNYSITCGGWAKTGGTFNEQAGTLTLTTVNPSLTGGDDTYYDVLFSSTNAGTAVITGANTFNNLTFTSIAATGQRAIQLGANQTVNGTLTLGTANTAIRRMFMFSDVIGTPYTITAAAIATLADVDFRDIVAAGASGTWAGTRLGNCLGNSNITFDAGKTVYWVGAIGGLITSTNWSLTQGGAADANNFPLAQDTAIIDNTIGATRTLNITGGTFQFGTFDFSQVTNAITCQVASNIGIYKNIILSSSITMLGAGTFNIVGQGTTQTITSAGRTLPQTIVMHSATGTLQLQDALTTSATFTLTSGTLDLNGNDLTVGTLSSTGDLARNINHGIGGELHVQGATFTASGSNLTTSGTGSISMDSASAKTFAGGGFSYQTLNQGGAGDLSITGANTFADITNTVQPCQINFPASVNTTVSDLSVNGTAGNLVKLRSSIAGTKANIVVV